jgi:hypothetical protein
MVTSRGPVGPCPVSSGREPPPPALSETVRDGLPSCGSHRPASGWRDEMPGHRCVYLQRPCCSPPRPMPSTKCRCALSARRCAGVLWADATGKHLCAVPVRSCIAWARPLSAMRMASPGPRTSGPDPAHHPMSAATSRRPFARRRENAMVQVNPLRAMPKWRCCVVANGGARRARASILSDGAGELREGGLDARSAQMHARRRPPELSVGV